MSHIKDSYIDKDVQALRLKKKQQQERKVVPSRDCKISFQIVCIIGETLHHS